MSEYRMTKEDWIALHNIMQMARIVCTKGVEALRSARGDPPSEGEG